MLYKRRGGALKGQGECKVGKLKEKDKQKWQRRLLHYVEHALQFKKAYMSEKYYDQLVGIALLLHTTVPGMRLKWAQALDEESPYNSFVQMTAMRELLTKEQTELGDSRFKKFMEQKLAHGDQQVATDDARQAMLRACLWGPQKPSEAGQPGALVQQLLLDKRGGQENANTSD